MEWDSNEILNESKKTSLQKWLSSSPIKNNAHRIYCPWIQVQIEFQKFTKMLYNNYRHVYGLWFTMSRRKRPIMVWRDVVWCKKTFYGSVWWCSMVRDGSVWSLMMFYGVGWKIVWDIVYHDRAHRLRSARNILAGGVLSRDHFRGMTLDGIILFVSSKKL